MAINKNHLFEELDGKKCAIAATQVSAARAAFLQQLLAFNGYEVVVVPSPPPKAAAKAAAPTEEESTEAPPLTFTVGVTNVMFNPVNALYGRFLKRPDGGIVTPQYWEQGGG
jgi:hypothetical protein